MTDLMKRLTEAQSAGATFEELCAILHWENVKAGFLLGLQVSK